MTRGADLERVRLEGKRVRTASLDVRATASLQPFPRVGFVVPRYQQSAVNRNRVKRRLREIVRCALLPSLPPVDLVVRSFPGGYRRTQAELERELTDAVATLLRRLAVPS